MSEDRRRTRERLERLLGGAGKAPVGSPARTTDPPPAARSRAAAGPAPPGTSSLYRLERELLGEEAAASDGLSVKERLERLVAVAAKARTKVSSARRAPAAGPPVSLDELLEGRRVENDRGELYQVDHVYPLDHWHGTVSLSRLKAVSPSAFSILARGDESVELDLDRALFLDTETTGLAGGAGTCAFLVGLGFVEEDRFVVRQLFMRDYAEEPAMLAELARLLERFDALVTYNGKAFDVPLLESRFVLARLPFPLAALPHFDLLHPARSLWKARLESCRLMDLEYALLRLEREEDVPGELIPTLYFDYVRSRDASRIFRVFAHNRDDILSLAALTVEAAAMLDEDAAPEDPLDEFSLGRLFERVARPERSMRHYERAVEAGLGGRARRRSLRQLALLHKRRGAVDEAVALWRRLAEDEGVEALEALQELAIVLEHRERDFAGALERCREALDRLADDPRLPRDVRARWTEAFEHRRRRLERRRGRAAARPTG